MKIKWIFPILGFMGLLIAAWLIVQPGVVKKIGNWKITKSDLQYRTQVAKIYFPEADEKAALMQLEKSAKYLQILERNGITVKDSDLDAEEERIRKQTQDPQTLEKVVKVFQGDKKSYRKNFILPNLVDHFIYYEYFLKNAELQSGAYEKTRTLIDTAKKESEDFEQISKKLGLKLVNVKINKKGVISSDSGANQILDLSDKKKYAMQKSIELKFKNAKAQSLHFWRDQVLSKMKEGSTLAQPVDQDTRLLVIHLKRRVSNNEGQVQVAVIEKLNFQEWLAKQ